MSPRRRYGAEKPLRAEALWALSAAAVWAGDDFEPVTVGMSPVQTAAAVMMVDLGFALGAGIRPEVEIPLLDTDPDLVELVLGDEERVVDPRYLVLFADIHEVDAHTVTDFDDLEVTELCRRGKTEHFGEESGTSYGVA